LLAWLAETYPAANGGKKDTRAWIGPALVRFRLFSRPRDTGKKPVLRFIERLSG